MKKKVLFIDRDGTLIIEPPIDFQVDSLEKLEFYPRVFQNLSKIAKELDYELVMVTNQDGLGTESFPYEDFIKHQEKMMIKTIQCAEKSHNSISVGAKQFGINLMLFTWYSDTTNVDVPSRVHHNLYIEK